MWRPHSAASTQAKPLRWKQVIVVATTRGDDDQAQQGAGTGRAATQVEQAGDGAQDGNAVAVLIWIWSEQPWSTEQGAEHHAWPWVGR